MRKDTTYPIRCYIVGDEYAGGEIGTIFFTIDSIGCSACGKTFKCTNRRLLQMKKGLDQGRYTSSHMFFPSA